jgi:Flp pilus assembly protein TadD
VAYLPVGWAGFVWDDDALITSNPAVAMPGGIISIWTSNAADICPLTLTTFWLEYRLWHAWPLPYHIVNLLFHAASALVLWRVLRRLRVPGAWLGAALWALHPVMAESAAWISEMKNTQSCFFFLLSILFFLRLVASEARRDYGLCLLFAALAMASKSSTVILPVVLCLCAWWMEGRWNVRTLARTAPIFGFSVVTAVVSIWTQRQLPGYNLIAPRTWAERFVTAGDAIWFYLGKLVWPQPLSICYPLWHVKTDNVMTWLPLLAIIAVFIGLCLGRTMRPVLFAFAYFLVALLPVLGFTDMTYFRYSYVADHFQYLASIGPLALAAAGATILVRSMLGNEGPQMMLGAAVLAMLGFVTWQRAVVFENGKAVWLDALAKDPDCWIGGLNLGVWYFQNGHMDEALAALQKVEPYAAKDGALHYNIGCALAAKGRGEEALAEFRKAVELEPRLVQARMNLGITLGQKGDFDAAVSVFDDILQKNPDDAEAHYNLGVTLMHKSDFDGAIVHLRRALELNPDAEAGSLGYCYVRKGDMADAQSVFEASVDRHPDDPGSRNNLGGLLLQEGRYDDAIAQFEESLRLDPNNVQAQKNIAMAKAAQMGGKGAGR